VETDYDETQLALKNAVATALERVQPTPLQRLRTGGGSGIANDIRAIFAEFGLFGLTAAEEAGGSGLGLLELLAVSEALGRDLLAVPLLFGPTALAAALPTHSSAAELVRDIVGGRSVVANALCDLGGWWDQPQLVAELNSGAICLRGQKPWIVGAVGADQLLVSARTRAGDALLVLVPVSSDGLTVRPAGPVSSAAWDATATFDAVDVPVDNVVARGPQAAAGLDAALCAGVVILGGQVLGACERLVALTVEHAKMRVQFDRPIGAFQAVQHHCAEMKLALEQTRAAVAYGAWRCVQDGGKWSPSIAALKAQASEAYRAIALRAIQVHGGIGVTWEHDAQLYFRDALYLEQLLGAPDEHLRRLGAWVRSDHGSVAGWLAVNG
jgi:alkylation response protein AidB-like acyl-CoA dehydrogenase